MIQKKLEQALEIGRAYCEEGAVATYIPELGKANPHNLGICLRDKEGNIYRAGDTTTRFTIQSVSKIISLAMALEYCGADTVFHYVGMEPSGESFNSLVELDLNSNRPYNPMINSGALTIASLLIPYVTFEDMLEYTRRVCLDPQITLDNAVYKSEMSHASRNMAIAYLLESKDIIENGVERTLRLYTKMCSLSVTAESLANLAMVLAGDGRDPITGKRLISSDVVRIVKVIMLTCGMYDKSGEFAVKVGMPSKSGVGGGLLSVARREMGIGIYGPSLDSAGNSVAGCKMLEWLAEDLQLRLYS